MGFIASSVSIKQGNYIRNDEKGKQISFHSV